VGSGFTDYTVIVLACSSSFYRFGEKKKKKKKKKKGEAERTCAVMFFFFGAVNMIKWAKCGFWANSLSSSALPPAHARRFKRDFQAHSLVSLSHLN
jgi:hypothetical protein